MKCFLCNWKPTGKIYESLIKTAGSGWFSIFTDHLKESHKLPSKWTYDDYFKVTQV